MWNCMKRPYPARLFSRGISWSFGWTGSNCPTGRPARREVIAHPGGVAILPYHDDGTVTVVRRSVSLWAGGDRTSRRKAGAGRGSQVCARRELEEETGLTAGTLTYLGCLLASPGYSDEVLHMYLARDLKTGEFHPDQDEFLERERVPFETLMEQVMRGELQDAKTVAALMKTKLLLGL